MTTNPHLFNSVLENGTPITPHRHIRNGDAEAMFLHAFQRAREIGKRFDLTSTGDTGYLDFVKASDMPADVCYGQDPAERSFIALRIAGRKMAVVIHRRYVSGDVFVAAEAVGTAFSSPRGKLMPKEFQALYHHLGLEHPDDSED